MWLKTSPLPPLFQNTHSIIRTNFFFHSNEMAGTPDDLKEMGNAQENLAKSFVFVLSRPPCAGRTDPTKSWLWDIFSLSCHWVDQCGSIGLSWLFLFVLEAGQRGVYWGIRWHEKDVAYLPAPGKSGSEELCAVWRAWKNSNSNLAIIYFQRKLSGWRCSSVIEYVHTAFGLILKHCKKTKATQEKGKWLGVLKSSKLHRPLATAERSFFGVCCEMHWCIYGDDKSLGVGLLLCQSGGVIVVGHLPWPVSCLAAGSWPHNGSRYEFYAGSRAFIHSENGLLFPWYLWHYGTSGNVLSGQTLLYFSGWLTQRPLLVKIQRIRDKNIQPV